MFIRYGHHLLYGVMYMHVYIISERPHLCHHVNIERNRTYIIQHGGGGTNMIRILLKNGIFHFIIFKSQGSKLLIRKYCSISSKYVQ